MKLHLGLTRKLALVFILFALVLLASVSGLYYNSGRAALEAATVSDLLSTAIEKQAALNRWVEDMQSDVATIAANPTLIKHVQTHHLEAESAALQVEHQEILAYLGQWAGEGKSLLVLSVLDPETGQVIASTDPKEVGKFMEDRPYFINGKNGPTIQNVYYSLVHQGPAMEAAAPIRSVADPRQGTQGQLVGVLAGQLNLDEMNAIVQRRTGLRQTGDVYLVNTSNLFVTQPRFVADPAVLQRGIHTEQVKHCLARNNGVVLADNYRGVPVIAVYRWLPERALCLLVEIDQAEALAPSRAFGGTVLLISILVLLAASALAVWLARGITRPVLALQAGAARFGRGERHVPLPETSGDELGQLAREFNGMAASLSEKEAQLQAYADSLEQRVEERTEALRASEEQYRRIVETAQEGIWTIDAASNTSLVNAKMAEMLGYTPDEMMGVPLFTFMDEEGKAIAAADVERRRQGIAEQHDFKFKRKDGADLWALLSTNPVFDKAGKYAGALAMVVDITVRKQMEEALRESESSLQGILQSTADGILAVGGDDRVLFANERFAEMWMVPQEVIASKDDAVLLRHVLDQLSDPPSFLHKVQELYRSNEASFDTLYFKDGRVFDRLSHPLMQGTALRGRVWSFRDITERKQAEEELQRTMQDLKRSNAELEQFAYVASHDLQEPLRMVASYTQLLAQRYQGRLDADADEFIAYAVDGAKRMQWLINDLLSYSRVRTRGQEFAPANGEMILAQAVDNLHLAIHESGAQVTHDPLPTVLADATQLAQVFQNLIGNAIKFHGAEPPRVHVSAKEESGRQTDEASSLTRSAHPASFVFSVRDNGIGIERQFFERIFAIFQRLHSTSEYPGTGIGLSICKRIVERHGGRIWVESQPGQGATFYFTLPAQEGNRGPGQTDRDFARRRQPRRRAADTRGAA